MPYIAYGDPQSETGLIFYPGAKVEETAYAPVMDGLAQQGIFCVTVKLPGAPCHFKAECGG